MNLMLYVTGERVAVLGAAGAIGSNLVQTILQLGITGDVIMYDPFEKGLQGAAEEIYHCSIPGARVTTTTSIEEALKDSTHASRRAARDTPRRPYAITVPVPTKHRVLDASPSASRPRHTRRIRG